LPEYYFVLNSCFVI